MEKAKTYKKIETAVTPVGPRILVKPAPVQDKTASGIINPGAHYVKPTAGTVIAIGTPIADRLIYCKPGDKILFNQGCGSEVIHMGEKCILMWAADQIAVTVDSEPIEETEDGK